MHCKISLRILCHRIGDYKSSRKYMSKNQQHNNLRALIVEKIAEKRGLKKNTIYRVLNGSRENEDVMDDYVTMSLSVGNALLNEVKRVVPFNNPQTSTN